MIQAELRGFDFFEDSDAPENCGRWLMCSIAPSDAPHERDGFPVGEWFDLFVCTPAWLATSMPEHGYLWGQHLLIVARWDVSLLRRAIEDLLAQVNAHAVKVAGGADAVEWPLIAALLSRVAQWEFGGDVPQLR